MCVLLCRNETWSVEKDNMVRSERTDVRMGKWTCNIRLNDNIYAIGLRNRPKLTTMKKYRKYTNYYKHLNGCSPNLMNEFNYLCQKHYN